MMGVRGEEQPPQGLNADWLATWRRALKVLKEQGSWAPEQQPLLDEYVFALRAAEDAREEVPSPVIGKEIDWPGLTAMSGGAPTHWDRHTKRAAALADQLGLTPRGRKSCGTPGDPRSSKTISMAGHPPHHGFLSATCKAQCPRCGVEKPLEDFAVDLSKSSRHKSHCKACDKARAKAYYAANADRIRPVARERERRKRAT